MSLTVYSVRDLSVDQVLAAEYDVAIFASGYESRCTSVAEMIDAERVRKVIVFGFRELGDVESRRKADALYAGKFGVDIVAISGADEKGVFDSLSKNINLEQRRITLLIDYTSMSRIWYLSVMNWFRVREETQSVAFTLTYVPGRYEGGVAAKIVDDIICLPGCEGVTVGNRDLTAVFGLGFDTLAPFTVFERIEPHSVFSMIGDPGASPGYAERAENLNRNFIEAHSSRVIRIPVGSVETAYRMLSELISFYYKKNSIALVPLGPKPHVLASLLTCMRFQEVCCLHIVGRQRAAVDVSAYAQAISTVVTMR